MALPGQRKVAFGFEKASLCFPEQRAGTWQRHKLRDTGEMAVRKRPKALTEPSQSRGLPMGIPRPAAKTQLILTNNEQHVSGNSSFAHKGGILFHSVYRWKNTLRQLTSKSIRQFFFGPQSIKMGAVRKIKTKRRTRDYDQVRADIASARHLELYKATKDEEDLPGLGKHYCVECSKWFESEHNMAAHTKGKNHKRRLRILREEAHTQKAAEAAVGLGTDNGVRSQETTEMVIMED
ncbi:hypothetical protein BO85DRAFT_470162 [Aspergillus piperis CBS 112811]|uniref:C2H2-type domain-containing protein n=6 Tax=Aspergillus subgen. Circumdati TaxID=2720871 RepID=A0A8G1QY43_9EURO|nr:hypothetical protein BO85DRAFT_470162 [Aspergillus piperis CBS 112811]RAH55839.1 hypothetical protein BO85DRAFT_470162 [Aspergillus piperis CBS 112811]